MDFLKGNRTYILSILLGIATALHAAGVFDAGLYATIMGILAPGTAMALRAGMK